MSKKEHISKSFEALNRESLIIKKMLSGKISPDEKAFFEDEIENDPFLREALEGLNQYKSKAEASEAITRASEIIATRTGYQPSLFKGSRFNTKLITAVAASAIILVVAVWALVKTPMFNNNLPPSAQMAENLKEDLFKKGKSESPVSELKDSTVSTTLSDSLVAISEADSALSALTKAVLSDDLGLDVPVREEVKASNYEEIAESDEEIARPIPGEKKLPTSNEVDDLADAYNNTADTKEKDLSVLDGTKVQEPLKQERLETTATDSYTESRAASGAANAKALEPLNRTASFVGGTSAMKTFISQKTKYPSKLKEPVSGTVRIELIIDEKGRVKSSKVISALHPLCDKEALRVIKAMPRWEPARSNGQAIEQKAYVSVPFSKP